MLGWNFFYVNHIKNTTATDSPLHNAFLAPLTGLGPGELSHWRECPSLGDGDWLLGGVHRVLHKLQSGRDYLQSFCSAEQEEELKCGHYFETLKSERRLALVAEAGRAIVERMCQRMPDALAAVGALDGFEVFAGDGHWHEHACHDQSKPGQSGGQPVEKKYAVGHLYGINLRTRALGHLIHCDEIARRKEHDMRALKRLEVRVLRQGAAKARKVLWVYDRAGIDFLQWYKWKKGSGIYFLSRAKENMNTEEVAPMDWDRDDPLNAGVEEDGILLGGPQTPVRLVRYRDPLTGELFEFITNELSLAPGIIVQLYRMRWDIEKAFDDFKNKLGELKAWASSSTAKTMQAHFLCITHNLMVLHEQELLEEHQLTNTAENLRRAKRLEQEMTEASKRGKQLPTLYLLLTRATQISVKFIRWLRVHLLKPTSLPKAHAHLRRLYSTL